MQSPAAGREPVHSLEWRFGYAVSASAIVLSAVQSHDRASLHDTRTEVFRDLLVLHSFAKSYRDAGFPERSLACTNVLCRWLSDLSAAFRHLLAQDAVRFNSKNEGSAEIMNATGRTPCPTITNQCRPQAPRVPVKNC